MSISSKNVVFDVVGTCVSYDAFFAAITQRLGPRLLSEGIKPRLFGFAWMEAAERECSYLDRSGRYTPFYQIFQPLFYRMLHMAGVEDPRSFATDEDAAFLVQSYRGLKAREGIHECLERLRERGFTVWALTSGDKARVRGYLEGNGIEIAEENFVTCDTLGVSKPDPEVYRYVLGKFAACEQRPWFAAAHMWDASAARHHGFRAAWCSVWEKEAATEVFGAMDVMADSLVEMADGIIAASDREP